jgi:hypothetical protein
MSNDFEKIAADLRMHFCPICKASFGCEFDEDGDCDCVGQEYADDWRKPWCPHCFELRKDELKCTCACRWSGGWCHFKDCPKYDPDQEDPAKMQAYIAGLIRRDLSQFIGKKVTAEEIADKIPVCDCAICAEKRKE